MTVKLQGPENHGGFSHAGESYAPDADGIITVPHDAVTAALDHGFTLAPEKAAKKADEADKTKAEKAAKKAE